MKKWNEWSNKGGFMIYKHILVAVDGSKTSELAFKEAVKLAKALHSKLRILHVIEKLPDHIALAVDVIKYQTISNKQAEILLKKFLQIATKHKISAETELIEIVTFKDKVSQKILKSAKAWKANLLIIGTHGRTGLSHFLLGSVAEEILKTTKLPVLIIHDSKHL